MKLNHTKRADNLLIIKSIFDKQKLKFWLSGWTLLYAYKADRLSELPFDEIGVFSSNFLPQKDLILNHLIANRFKVIKDTIYVTKIQKDGLVIDINKYFFNQKYCLYNEIKLPNFHFKKFYNLNFFGNNFNIPSKTNDLISFVYFPSKLEKLLRIFRSHIFKNLSPYKYYFEFYQYIIGKSPFFLNNIIRKVLMKDKIIIKRLSLEEFKNLKFNSNEFDLIFRSKHFEPVIKSNKHITIGEIINSLSIEGKLEEVKKTIEETYTENEFNEPIYYSRKFWQTGNNFFFYPIYFGFRKNVIPYEKSNQYISNRFKPSLFTHDYFISLKKMTDSEIRALLYKNPIEIKNKGFASGRHRVAAMIGRIVRNETYIPISAYELKN